MDPAKFHLRHGTQDKQVFEDVLVNNQYLLPTHLSPEDIVIDIGANIGAFAVACLSRGAGTVVCFEPGEENYLQLAVNVRKWPGQAPCFNAAVWRSDRADTLAFVDPGTNTACGACINTDSQNFANVPAASVRNVTAIGLDELLFNVTDGGKRRVRLLKIDAEGAEYAILYTCKHLYVVDEIVGETHQYPAAWEGDKFFVGDYPNDEACDKGMAKFLASQGFTVELKAESEDNGICTLFWATRTRREDYPKNFCPHGIEMSAASMCLKCNPNPETV